MKIIFLVTTCVAYIIPTITLAVSDVLGFTILLYDVILRLEILFWALAVAFFVWGVVKFISNAEDSAEREKGKSFIIWSVVSFIVLASLWAIVSILIDSAGIGGFGGAPDYIDRNGNIVAP